MPHTCVNKGGASCRASTNRVILVCERVPIDPRENHSSCISLYPWRLLFFLTLTPFARRYAPGDYDLGGFAVGAVRKGDVMPKNVKAGDILIGLPSSGVHSNGFSLVRKLLEKEGLSWDDVAPWGEGETVAENLLTPTKIYVKQVLPLMRKQMYHSSAHITGGGLLENLNRSIPSHIDAVVDFHPALTPVFKWMQEASGLDDPHMLKTFNCGVGMILVVNEGEEQACLDLLREGGEVGACVMGKLVGGGTGSVKCTFTLE